MARTKNCMLIVMAAIVLLSSSCVVNKPVASSTSAPDYNKRVTVQGAYYHRKVSAVGWTVMGLSTAGGAVAGAFLPMVSYYDGGEKVNLAPVSGTIGAIAGFGTSYLITRAFGWGKIPMCKDAKKWVKRANPQYVIYNKKTENNFNIMHRSAETNYTVKNMQDVEDFRAAFPSTTNYNEVVKQSIATVKRDELLKVLEYYPQSIHSLDVKRKYVEKSPSVSELFKAIDRFPETKANVEGLAVPLVSSIPDALAFYKRFPTSKFNQKVVVNSFKTANQSVNQITILKEVYEDEFYQNSRDAIASANNLSKRNYLDALYRLESPKKLIDLEIFYDRYDWLEFSEKSTDIVKNYWNLADATHSDGRYIIYLMKQLASNQSYTTWGISEYEVNQFIKARLQEQVGKFVKVDYPRQISTTNDEWERWCNNSTYTAGLVAERGDIQYLLYGEVENKSKFDLPIAIVVNAGLNRKISFQGTGTWTNLGANIANYAADRTGTNIQQVANSNNQFKVPSLPSKSKSTYAVMLDYGNGSKKLGINLADWVKIKAELYLDNLNTKAVYNDYHTTEDMLREQEMWLYMAENGLPNAKLTDLWRGENVKDTEWNRRWVVEQERRERARIEWERSENERRRNEQLFASESINNKQPDTKKDEDKLKIDDAKLREKKDAEERRKIEATNCSTSQSKELYRGVTSCGYPWKEFRVTCWDGKTVKYVQILRGEHTFSCSGEGYYDNLSVLGTDFGRNYSNAIKVLCNCK